MTLRPLVLLGAGGFARETAELVRALNEVEPTWDLLGFADDDDRLHGTVRGGLPILGSVASILQDTDHEVVVCVASPAAPRRRLDLVDRLAIDAARCPSLVHPAAVVGRSCAVGGGSVVHAGCVLTADVEIGRHVALMPQCVLTHDDGVGDGATFGAGVRVAGGVTIGRAAYLGSGCAVREQLTIGEAAVLGMGAVATRPIPPGEIWAGVPARPLRAASLEET